MIMRETILPHFKQNPPDYGGGIEAGADAIIKQMSLPPTRRRPMSPRPSRRNGTRDASPGILPVIFWMIVILFVIFDVRPRGRRSSLSPPPRPRHARSSCGASGLRRRSSRGGGGGSLGRRRCLGGGGGGFGGFGGGSFGGGGAWGSW